MSLGLKPLESVDVIQRLEQDLAFPQSKSKSSTTPLEWHIQASKFLLQSFNGQCITELKKFKLIPLQSGDFTSLLEGEVFFPESDGAFIPTDLGLRLVQPEVTKSNEWRKNMFRAIGVTEPSVLKVRRLIFERYKSEDSRATIKSFRSVAHLRYLYHTHHRVSTPHQGNHFFDAISADMSVRSGPDDIGTASAKIKDDQVYGRSTGLTSSSTPTSDRRFGSLPETSGGLFGNMDPRFSSPSAPTGRKLGDSSKDWRSATGSTTTDKPFSSRVGAFVGVDGNFSTRPSNDTAKSDGSLFGGSGNSKPVFNPFELVGNAKPISGFGAISLSPSLFGSPATPSPICEWGSSNPINKLQGGGGLFGNQTSSWGSNVSGNSSFKGKNTTHVGEIKASSNPFSSGLPPASPQPSGAPKTPIASGAKQVPFKPLIDNGYSTPGEKLSYQSICCQTVYQNFSYEELRLADYPPLDSKSAYKDLWVFSESEFESELVPCRRDVYFPSKEEFSVQELMKPYGKPTRTLSILSSSYFLSISEEDTSGSLTWESWLHKELGILRAPRLIDPNNSARLGNIFRYLAKSRPEKLLGTLKSHWKSYEALLTPVIIAEISHVKIPCQNGENIELCDTFLPILEPYAQKFLLGEGKLPFLILDPQSTAEEWMFLTRFGTCATEDVEYYLTLLGCVRKANESASNLSSPERVFKLYEAIYARYWDSENKTADGEEIRSFFQSRNCLYTPGSNLGGTAIWTSPFVCLWEAPSYLSCRSPLQAEKVYRDNPMLVNFLRDTLQIPDISWEILMKELDFRATYYKSQQNQTEISDIYQRLGACRPQLAEEELSSIRNEFRKRKRIYISPNGWSSTGDCIWCDKARIEGKLNLSAQYKDFRAFFVDFLGVQVPDLGMLVEELKKVVFSKRSVESPKSLIWQINSMDPTAKDLRPIRSYAIFPVRVGNKEPRLLRDVQDFAIVDHENLARAFKGPGVKGELTILDFPEIEDVRKLQPFLAACNIEHLYLSNVVEQITSFSDEAAKPIEPDDVLTRSLRRRAYALFRCTFHWRSTRTIDGNQSLYQLLLHSQVFVTDEITTKLEVIQNGEKIQAILNKSTLHIEEEDSKLQVYVPKDPKDRELCYRRLLPARLLRTLMTKVGESPETKPEPGAVAIIADILNCSDFIVNDLLEDAGIVPVPFSDEYVLDTPDTLSTTSKSWTYSNPSVSDGSRTQVGSPVPEYASSAFRSARHLSTRSPSPQAGQGFSDPSQYAELHQRRITPVASPRRSQLSVNEDITPSLFSVDSSRADYCKLLEYVINAAKNKHGGFPSKGAFDVQDLLSALPMKLTEDPPNFDLPFGVRSENQLAHDMRVGAAGELYAFELLKRLGPPLPNFGQGYPKIQNWESTVRKYVSVHEDYRDLEPWKGAETADITYDDIHGDFTNLMIENGYLDYEVWNNATPPKYFLEVKTTTKDCGTRFYLSKSQYRRMHDMKLTDGQSSATVYIILRVFNLDTDRIDMRLYVDPARMQGKGLEFTPESYSVVLSSSIQTVD